MNKFLSKIIIFLRLCSQASFCSEEIAYHQFKTPMLTQNDRDEIQDIWRDMGGVVYAIENAMAHYNDYVAPFLSEILNFPMFFDVNDEKFPKQLEYLKPDQRCRETIKLIMKLVNGSQGIYDQYEQLLEDVQDLPTDSMLELGLLRSKFTSLFDEDAQLSELKHVAPKTSVDNVEQYQNIDEVIVAFGNFVKEILAHKEYFKYPVLIENLYKKILKLWSQFISTDYMNKATGKILHSNVKAYIKTQQNNINNLRIFLGKRPINSNDVNILPEYLTWVLSRLEAKPSIGIRKVISYTKEAIASVCDLFKFYNTDLVKLLQNVLEFPIHYDIPDEEFPAQLIHYKPDEHSKKDRDSILKLPEWLNQIYGTSQKVFSEIQNVPNGIMPQSDVEKLQKEFVDISEMFAPLLEVSSVKSKNDINPQLCFLESFRESVKNISTLLNARTREKLSIEAMDTRDKILTTKTTLENIIEQLNKNKNIQNPDQEYVGYLLTMLKDMDNLFDEFVVGDQICVLTRLPRNLSISLRRLEVEKLRRSNFMEELFGAFSPRNPLRHWIINLFCNILEITIIFH